MVNTKDILDTEPVKGESITDFLNKKKVENLNEFQRVSKHQADVTDFIMDQLRRQQYGD